MIFRSTAIFPMAILGRAGRLFRRCAPVLVAMGLAACAARHDVVPGTGEDVREVAGDYRIAVGDRLNVYVWRNPDVSMELEVRPDGAISTPLVEDMRAAGKTPSELARDIEKALGEYIRQPIVTVIVKGFSDRASRNIRIIGEVKQPRLVAYQPGTTVLDAIIMVGGVTDFSDPNETKVVRTTGDGRQVLPVRLGDIMDGDMTSNIRLRPGDVVIVPESLF